MRNDAGVNGDAQRIEQMVWLLFLKIYDAKEEQWEFDDESFVSIIPEKLKGTSLHVVTFSFYSLAALFFSRGWFVLGPEPGRIPRHLCQLGQSAACLGVLHHLVAWALVFACFLGVGFVVSDLGRWGGRNSPDVSGGACAQPGRLVRRYRGCGRRGDDLSTGHGARGLACQCGGAG